MELVNVYSRSRSELGRLLSNFARTPFTSSDGVHTFQSVEGWWYWFKTGKRHESLKALWGFEAKKQGRQFPVLNPVIKPHVLRAVYLRKLECNPQLRSLLLAFDGQFEHFYVMNGRRVDAPRHLWTARLWESVRDELRAESL